MAAQAKGALGVEALRAVADKGFYDGEQVRRCTEAGITPYVPQPEKAKGSGERAGISPEFYKDKFRYDASTDTIVCPAGHRMYPGSTFRRHWRQRPEGRALKTYRTKACSTCPHHMTRCTLNPEGRTMERSEYETVLEAMSARMKTGEGRRILELRKALAEHPFGTIKRGLEQGYLLLKGTRKVRGEIGLTMTVYDMRRALNIVGAKGLTAALGS
jgi:hypothetical protein